MAKKHQIPEKRKKLAHLFVCNGSSCGGKCEDESIDWLKKQWKKRKLEEGIFLTLTECMGPCSNHGIACMVDSESVQWISGLVKREDYKSLVKWAEETLTQNVVVPLGSELEKHRTERCRNQTD